MIVKPEDFENERLNEIEAEICQKSEMTLSERQFLNGIIRQVKPKKVLEVGIAAGSSSAIILNAIKDIKDAKLYSLDYSTQYYRDKTLKTGFILDKFPKLKEKFTIMTGGMACNHLEKVGGDIDVCLLDTMHSNPGEFLDYLQVIPFMKKGGIIILHDISLHAFSGYLFQTTCCTLMSSINGIKIVPKRSEHEYFPNIGAVILDENAIENVFDIFNCLILPWAYEITNKDISDLKKYFKKHYSEDCVELFLKACLFNKENFKNAIQNSPKAQGERSFLGFWKKLRKTLKMYLYSI